LALVSRFASVPANNNILELSPYKRAVAPN
jgi:hypothetical protein